MILKMAIGDIMNALERIVVFAINTDGYNDSGLAGTISSSFWPELACTKPKKLGDVMTKEHNGKVFYALVCHSLSPGGWANAPRVISEFFDSTIEADGREPVAFDETIATVMMGGGPVGKIMGADVNAIRQAIQESRRPIVIYTK